jgi:phosphopantothenoylcysteine decarboxylase/phosphopantothenate--cysteine ligase
VGFKLETSGDDEAMIERARETLDRADLAFVVANDASAMGSETARVLLVTDDDATVHEGDKDALGGEIADALVDELS